MVDVVANEGVDHHVDFFGELGEPGRARAQRSGSVADEADDRGGWAAASDR